MRSDLLRLAVLATAAALVSLPAFAGLEIPICTDSPANQWMPAASGTRVVWADSRNGDWDIYLYDLATGAEEPICTASGDQMWPEIDGDRVVWRDHRDSTWAVHMYDLATGDEWKLADAPITGMYDVWTSQGPDISGDYVVWSDSRNGHLDVFLYDLSLDTERQITSGDGDHGSGGPRVQGERIVYRDSRNDPAGDIYVYDIAADEEAVVAEGDLDQAQPDIWGDIVVWRQADDTDFDIYWCDLSEGTAWPLVATWDIEDHPRVAGRFVVWSSHEMDVDGTVKWENVGAFDLATKAKVPLTVNSPYFGTLGPAVSDSGIVAFEDFRDGTRDPQTNADIYGYLLTRFTDVLLDYWAYDAVEACASAGIVSGFPDGTYAPAGQVTRDQMAVYISRAIAGGDAGIVTAPATASFTDVPTDYWAFKYVEYARGHNIVSGYPDELYHPADRVDRGQMAIFVARSIVDPTGDAGLVSYTPPTVPSFPGVATDYYAFKYIEYIKSKNVTGGYPDGKYHPEYIVTRDQMAVYVARAFQLQ